MQKRLSILRVMLLAVLTLGLVLGLCQRIVWVGSTNLIVEFVVTDAETGEPIDGAAISIESWGGFYRERSPMSFRLETALDGRATYVCADMMCGGSSGHFPPRETYGYHIPDWLLRVSAKGYESTAQEWLENLRPARFVECLGSRQAKLLVPIALYKSKP